MLAILVIVAILSMTARADVNNENLVAVVQLFRHGQRTPSYPYTNDPFSDSSNWGGLNPGQLTNEGKRQSYELGQFTRNRYEGFLPKNYSNNDFYAQSTDVDRTLMSALSNIAGLYPPAIDERFLEDLPWQPIPIHLMSTSVSGRTDCPAADTELAQILATEQIFLSLDNDYADIYEYLTNNTGDTINSVVTAWDLYDTLSVEDLTGLELPVWTQSVYPEPLTLFAKYAFMAWSYSVKQKRFETGVFMNTVVEYFEEIFADPTSTAKYQMYSAHESNVGPVLSTLGYEPLYLPGFSSSIYFELRNNSGKAVVNILHRDNGILEKLNIPGYEFDCPLDEFRKFLSPYLMDSDTFTAECSESDSDSFTGKIYARIQELKEQIYLVRSYIDPSRNPKKIDAN